MIGHSIEEMLDRLLVDGAIEGWHNHGGVGAAQRGGARALSTRGRGQRDAHGFGQRRRVQVLDAAGPPRDELERRFEAYNLCIKINKCRMDPGDFVDYYDLKYKLLQEED